MNTEDDFLIDVARLIATRGMSIDEFYTALGVDLDNHRCDAADVLAELSGIFKGWGSSPPN